MRYCRKFLEVNHANICRHLICDHKIYKNFDRIILSFSYALTLFLEMSDGVPQHMEQFYTDNQSTLDAMTTYFKFSDDKGMTKTMRDLVKSGMGGKSPYCSYCNKQLVFDYNEVVKHMKIHMPSKGDCDIDNSVAFIEINFVAKKSSSQSSVNNPQHSKPNRNARRKKK